MRQLVWVGLIIAIVLLATSYALPSASSPLHATSSRFIHPVQAPMIAIDTSPVQGRIVGGTVVTPHEFPWQVFLTISTSEGTFFCGGSVIMRQYVLTAAHCVTDYLGDLYNASQIRVYAGVHDRRQLNTVRTQGRTGLQVSVHRLYNAERYDYDVAVIKLNAPFTLNAYVKTIQLAKPTEHSLFATGTDVTVSGWGIIEDGNVPSILRKTTVDIISTAACNAKNSYDGAVTNRMLCAARTGKDSCQGDSGGPLFLRQGSIYKQVGVVSWGNGCALARYPGVYSNIGVLRAWIATKVPALP